MIVGDDFIADVNRLGVDDVHGMRVTTGVLLWRKGPVVGGVTGASYFLSRVCLLSGDQTPALGQGILGGHPFNMDVTGEFTDEG